MFFPANLIIAHGVSGGDHHDRRNRIYRVKSICPVFEGFQGTGSDVAGYTDGKACRGARATPMLERRTTSAKWLPAIYRSFPSEE